MILCPDFVPPGSFGWGIDGCIQVAVGPHMTVSLPIWNQPSEIHVLVRALEYASELDGAPT